MRFPKMLALGAGGLSAIGFAPIGWWPVTLICFAVLMHLVREAPGWKAGAARGYWFGVGHFTVGLNWIAGAFQFQDAMPHWLGWVAVVALALYIGVYPAMAAGAARWLISPSPWRFAPVPLPASGERAGFSFILIFAAMWIITEYLRAVVFTGFAWNPLGVVAIPAHLAIGATLVGTYGLSGLMVLTSGGLLAVYNRRRLAGFLLIAPIFLVSMPPIGWLLQWPPQSVSTPPLIRIVQPNIGQQDKHNEAFDDINFAKLANLTGMPGPEPRLILWPEAAVPEFIGQNGDEARVAREKLAALIGPKDILLTGAVKLEFVNRQDGVNTETVLGSARNAMFVLDGQGRILGRYDKSHLVPYGEYLPMAPFLSAIGLSRLVPGTVDFWPGPGPRTYAVPGFGKMGVQICYEIIFSGQVVDEAHRPDFLFNPSNDAWFGAWGPVQHLAQARLRAIEEGIPIIRATPTGISAVIDAGGNILHKLPYQKAGYIETRLPPPHPPTLFSRYGNSLSLAFAFFLGLMGIALRRFGR